MIACEWIGGVNDFYCSSSIPKLCIPIVIWWTRRHMQAVCTYYAIYTSMYVVACKYGCVTLTFNCQTNENGKSKRWVKWQQWITVLIFNSCIHTHTVESDCCNNWGAYYTICLTSACVSFGATKATVIDTRKLIAPFLFYDEEKYLYNRAAITNLYFTFFKFICGYF